MSALKTVSLRTIRPGLALAAFFGWLLSFPMFGPLLSETAGVNTLVLGLGFVISHATGLMLIQLLPPAASPLPIRSAGALISALTVFYAVAHRSFAVDLLMMVTLGVTAAYLVLAWTTEFVRRTYPLQELAVAMAGANVIYSVISMPLQLPAKELLLVLAVLAGTGVLLFPEPGSCGRTVELSSPKSDDTAKTIKAMAAFTIAVYLIGGIWYHSFALQLSTAPQWEASIGSLFYVIAILMLAQLAARSQPADLAPLSLSALGVGLLIMLSGLGLPAAEFAYLAGLNLGLAAADLFLWYALWFLGKLYGGQRSFGLGLGFSLLLIALSVIVSSSGWPGGSPGLLLITALTLLFLIVPLIFRYPFQQLQTGHTETAVARSTANLSDSPDILTPTESTVYRMLIQGAGDAEIAEELFISRHTVKFHVRNILRKMGAGNRKELLSAVLQQERKHKSEPTEETPYRNDQTNT